MSIFDKTFVKFAAGFGVIIILVVGFVAYGGIKKYRNERAVKQAIADYKAKLAADTYGGKTPEETLSMFIAALKKGDIDLASKYFVLSKQVELKDKLNIVKTKNYLNNMAGDLERAEKGKPLSDSYINFFPVSISNIVGSPVTFIKASNGLWKIESL